MVAGAYTFFITLALLAGGVAMWALLRGSAGNVRAAVFTLATVAVFPGGARLLYLATHPGRFTDTLGSLVAITPTHFSLFGGILASAMTALLLARLLGLSVYKTADAVVPALAGTIVLAKSGCFLNGCCPGVASDLPWAVTLPGRDVDVPVAAAFGGLDKLIKSTFANPGPTHPIAAYEIVAVLAVAALALAWGRKQSPGAVFFTFIIGFSAFRWLIFYLRAGQSPLEAIFYPGLYAVIILASTMALLKTRPPRPVTPD